jgi:hypothetical protein
MARILGTTRPTLGDGLRAGEKVSSGPYADLKTAMITERLGIYRAHLFRTVLEQGVFCFDPHPDRYGRHKPTLPEVAQWTGYSLRVLKAWLQPPSSPTRREMPLPAIRLIIHEFWMRDEGHYDWPKLLRKCR